MGLVICLLHCRWMQFPFLWKIQWILKGQEDIILDESGLNQLSGLKLSGKIVLFNINGFVYIIDEFFFPRIVFRKIV